MIFWQYANPSAPLGVNSAHGRGQLTDEINSVLLTQWRLQAHGRGQRADEALRWVKRDHQEAVTRKVAKLLENEPDWRVKIWARVRLTGEPLSKLARELGYADGTGVHQVARRLEATAKHDRGLTAKMEKMKKAVQ